MERQTETKKTAVRENDKKTYHEPKLVTYGDIRELTMNMMMTGSDGAAGNDNKSL